MPVSDPLAGGRRTLNGKRIVAVVYLGAPDIPVEVDIVRGACALHVVCGGCRSIICSLVVLLFCPLESPTPQTQSVSPPQLKTLDWRRICVSQTI